MVVSRANPTAESSSCSRPNRCSIWKTVARDTGAIAIAPRFTIEARVSGHAPAVATDNSKRLAEQTAASLLLERIEAGGND